MILRHTVLLLVLLCLSVFAHWPLRPRGRATWLHSFFLGKVTAQRTQSAGHDFPDGKAKRIRREIWGKSQECGKVWTLHTCLFVFFKLIYFNWRLITLQYCSGFCHTLIWISHGCTCVPHPEPSSHLTPHPILQGCPSASALSALFHASALDWWSISHMVIYMFQVILLNQKPCLLPQSPKVYSLYLCLFCCFAYRVFVTIFLNSIYMC